MRPRPQVYVTVPRVSVAANAPARELHRPGLRAANRHRAPVDSWVTTHSGQEPRRLPTAPSTVSGWVETVRDQKKVQFVILRDESGAVQLVHPATRRRGRLGTGCRARRPTDLRPRARHVPHRDRRAQARRAGQARRRRGQARLARRRRPRRLPRRRSPPTPASTSAWTGASSTCASAADNLIFRVQTTLEHAMRTWWVEHDFIEIHTPKLMASAIRVAAPSCSR